MKTLFMDEFRLKNTYLKQNLPIQICFAVFGLAKLKMLQFYYDFIDFYFDGADYQYCQLDTDSVYTAFSAENLNDILKPDLQEDSHQNKHNRLCRTEMKQRCCLISVRGLFKEEFQGDGIPAVSSKMYHCIGGRKKLSFPEINLRKNKFVKANYRNDLLENSSQEITDKGFRIMNRVMSSSSLVKIGLTLFNDKPLKNHQKRNKREIEELLEHTLEPVQKKRKSSPRNLFSLSFYGTWYKKN